MGKGIDLARPGLHADVIDDLKDQLLIVFLKRLVASDGTFSVPVAEIDDTGRDTLSFSVDANNVFHFVIGKKQ